MRKSFNGLQSLAWSHFQEELDDGSLFVFMNRRRTLLKALYWDGDGLALWSKRLAQGCFRQLPDGEPQIDRRQLVMLLEGISPKRLNKRLKITCKNEV